MHHEWSGRIVTVLIRQKDVSGTQGHELKASGQNISELIAKYGVESSLLYGGIDTVKGTAIGAITYEFNGPGWHVDEFLRELAANSDVIDFGTAAKPVAYADAVAGHAPTPKTAPMTHWRPILPPRPPRPPPHMKEPTHDHPRQPA